MLLARLLAQQNQEHITSLEIERQTGWSQSLIRRDISLLEIRCGSSNGYKIRELSEAIKSALIAQDAPDSQRKCCIVGLGNLGAAFLESAMPADSPFVIKAGFDFSVNRVEILKASFPLHPTSMLEEVISTENIEFAILTVCENMAQSTAERLSSCGIKGIANYTNTVLSLPESVSVENVSPLSALTNLLSDFLVSARLKR